MELSEQQTMEDILSQTMTRSKVILQDEAPSIVAAKDTAEQLKTMSRTEKQAAQRYGWFNFSILLIALFVH